jgi:hypothetical protein
MALDYKGSEMASQENDGSLRSGFSRRARCQNRGFQQSAGGQFLEHRVGVCKTRKRNAIH